MNTDNPLAVIVRESWFRSLLSAYANSVRFLFATPFGLLLLSFLIVLVLSLRVWQALRSRSLACAAAQKTFSWPEKLVLAFRELYTVLLSAISALPVLFAVLAIAGTLFLVADSLERFERVQERSRRISELGTVLCNLEQRYRVADVSVRYSDNGQMQLDFAFYAPGEEARIAGHQSVELPGSTVYFDALVCNFDYAEIAAGRRINLAIPYRVFSDQLAQSMGVPLELRNTEGIPYVYDREAHQIYGITPQVYHDRLGELLVLLDNENEARLNGIVRSVYGSAVHRRVRTGERFTVWIEQSGGLTIKTPIDF